MDGAIAAMTKNAVYYESSPYDTNKQLTNLALFVLIAERDIQAIKIDALTHPDKWKRNLSLRVMLLTVHELDLGKVSGRELKPSLEKAGVSTEIQGELFSALRETKKAQTRAKKLLNSARNEIIAHRDADALLQMRSMEKLSPDKTFGIIEDFYAAANKLYPALSKAIIEAGSIGSYIQQKQTPLKV